MAHFHRNIPFSVRILLESTRRMVPHGTFCAGARHSFCCRSASRFAASRDPRLPDQI